MDSILDKIQKSSRGADLINKINSNNRYRISLKNLSGSSKSLYSAAISSNINRIHFFILPEKEDAAYFINDLENIMPQHRISFFPSFLKHSTRHGQAEKSNIILRTEVLNQINNYDNKYPLFIVSHTEAVIGKVLSKNNMSDNTLKLSVGETVSMEFIEDVLNEYNFERVDFVYEPGQYAVRGGIIDVFSFAGEQPYRIDFFGDDVESIRMFDIETQLSDNKCDSIEIIPNLQNIVNNETAELITNIIPDNSIVWSSNMSYIFKHAEQLYNNANLESDEEDINTNQLIATKEELEKSLNRLSIVDITSKNLKEVDNEISFETSPQPNFNKNFEILADNFEKNQNDGYTNIVLSSSPKQIERLTAIFNDIREGVTFTDLPNVIHEGFIDHSLKLCFYTDHQIFERYHKFKLKGNFEKKDVISIKEINNMQPGDFVVHIDHGVGKFGGLVKSKENGKVKEAIRLIYRDNDILDVSIHNLHRISKFKSKDSTPPKMNKLGTGAWQRLKQSTKKKVKDIAKELIALYAKRREQKGFAFTEDNYLQQELEASFIYEDTPDQLKATKAVKRAMEKDIPMDMLICGDVGFGKTEVAIRAAFKAVCDNKQVAILVPTTILALQHYHSFKKRLKDFPVNIDYVSRLKKAKELKQSINDLKSGKTNIIIGTHKLVGKDIVFKDLGLLIIDEEQRFGVAMKEKLKKLKVNVDTLTLTATPIPRTLQFSLMGARDLAIINTPPPNRHPILTELHTFNEEVIKETIHTEIERGGQVFFINNRVQNIEEIAALVNRLVPDVRTVVAHGQMEGKVLEKIMLDFINHEFDVLIATTIIESGLDIPNANTIIINNAHQFGLSELHQLRGRVGRSNKKAYCYLLAPPVTTITQEARRKLTAIENYSDLGSGMNIAMQDLDIRGAGNMLGGEQSGFISDIGFETYHKILSEAVQELKETDFKSVFESHENIDLHKKTATFISDCQIDTDLEILIPDHYISNTTERIKLYRELDNISESESLTEFENNLTDRFGELPQVTRDLLNIVKLRWKAIELGFEKVILKNKIMIIHFIHNKESMYYQSPVFMEVIQKVQQNSSVFKMREKSDKLTLVTNNINSVQQALDIINRLDINQTEN
ncbi:MAG: transcription-repair coupling factor [Bacteroidales bacterium]|nr:transcription-repair coupling factor [Bacteroidales bacterium]